MCKKSIDNIDGRTNNMGGIFPISCQTLEKYSLGLRLARLRLTHPDWLSHHQGWWSGVRAESIFKKLIEGVEYEAK